MTKNSEPKQIIVIRKDLNMSAGKLAAQVAHASLQSYFAAESSTASKTWKKRSYTKVVLYVKSEAALLKLYATCKAKLLPCALITDEGRTEFKAPTFTCIGIGPCFPEDFEGVTNKLRLFDGEVIPR